MKRFFVLILAAMLLLSVATAEQESRIETAKTETAPRQVTEAKAQTGGASADGLSVCGTPFSRGAD